MQVVQTSLKHPGTGRVAAVVPLVDFVTPVAVAAGRYVLVVASEKQTVPFGTKTARAWIDAGASYICVWGPDSEAVEETFDYAAFLPEYGEPLPFTLMTTSHNEKTPKDALWFAFYNAVPPDDLDDELNAVVIVVDSDSLAAACTAWVTENPK